ncbi:MAG: cyclomaltodextrinase / maltogenic alpha-amylase / neopullulanase, partial [Actinomycetota bacterium]|nr:cyclomaltodextrinase / maltogenic alpha-amylase / neopullulanase [Actinomycetota bacterium]
LGCVARLLGARPATMGRMTNPGAAVDRSIPPRGVWWHVYPLGFLGAERFAVDLGPDPTIQHRLPTLEQWLDYSLELGVEGWVLGPVFASTSHGYDTVDHFRVDPRLGDADDLAELLVAAHERGLRIVLDGVFNHVGRGFERFGQALAEGQGSESAGWFQLDWPDNGGEPEVRAFEGHDQLVTLNHGNPAVRDYVVSVMVHWADVGVDGWRLDAAYAAPVDFWHEVTGRVRERHPECWLFGEVIHGDYPAVVVAAGLDSVTQYELWKAIASSINDVNFFELAHALGRHNGYLDTFVPVTFLGNHDTTRIASKLSDHDFLPHALAVLMGVGGTPVVYAGDEQGYAGVKYEREGGDDEVRPPFPEHPREFSALGAPTFELHQQLIAFRRDRPWLVDARTEVTHLANATMVLVTTATTGQGRRVAVALNLSAADCTLPLPPGDWLRHAGTGAPGPDGVTLPAKGWALLSDG